MRSARVRALLQSSLLRQVPELQKSVEMRPARVRALPRHGHNENSKNNNSRNEARPRKGIATIPVVATNAVVKPTVEMRPARVRA